jgi:calcineurin-like phosphoesterase family protein
MSELRHHNYPFNGSNMLVNYFIADTHFRHTNIIKYCDRPFDTVEEMNDTIIRNINHIVGPNDVLWHLGDFAYGKGATEEEIIVARNRINCRNINLIIGNHDHLITKNKTLRSLFNMIIPYFNGYIGEEIFVLTHRPYDQLSHFNEGWMDNIDQYLDIGAIHLFGHTHNISHITPNNLSVENINYTPVHYEPRGIA